MQAVPLVASVGCDGCEDTDYEDEEEELGSRPLLQVLTVSPGLELHLVVHVSDDGVDDAQHHGQGQAVEEEVDLRLQRPKCYQARQTESLNEPQAPVERKSPLALQVDIGYEHNGGEQVAKNEYWQVFRICQKVSQILVLDTKNQQNAADQHLNGSQSIHPPYEVLDVVSIIPIVYGKISIIG